MEISMKENGKMMICMVSESIHLIQVKDMKGSGKMVRGMVKE
jgi:hypothetical protein